MSLKTILETLGKSLCDISIEGFVKELLKQISDDDKEEEILRKIKQIGQKQEYESQFQDVYEFMWVLSTKLDEIKKINLSGTNLEARISNYMPAKLINKIAKEKIKEYRKKKFEEFEINSQKIKEKSRFDFSKPEDIEQLYQSNELKDYQLIRGSHELGGFGLVVKAMSKDGHVMIKLPSNYNTIDRLAYEAMILEELKGMDGITEIIEKNLDATIPYFVMKYYREKTLIEATKNAQKNKKIQISKNLATAIAELHERGIIHRDIKPENILVDDENIRIIDFGLAKKIDQKESFDLKTRTTNLHGTTRFMAPEFFNSDQKGDEISDIYSYGATLHYIFTREFIQKNIPLPTGSKLIDKIIKKCIKRRKLRYQSISEIKEELEKKAEKIEKKKSNFFKKMFAYLTIAGTTLLLNGLYSTSENMNNSGQKNTEIVQPPSQEEHINKMRQNIAQLEVQLSESVPKKDFETLRDNLKNIEETNKADQRKMTDLETKLKTEQKENDEKQKEIQEKQKEHDELNKQYNQTRKQYEQISKDKEKIEKEKRTLEEKLNSEEYAREEAEEKYENIKEEKEQTEENYQKLEEENKKLREELKKKERPTTYKINNNGKTYEEAKKEDEELSEETKKINSKEIKKQEIISNERKAYHIQDKEYNPGTGSRIGKTLTQTIASMFNDPSAVDIFSRNSLTFWLSKDMNIKDSKRDSRERVGVEYAQGINLDNDELSEISLGIEYIDKDGSEKYEEINEGHNLNIFAGYCFEINENLILTPTIHFSEMKMKLENTNLSELSQFGIGLLGVLLDEEKKPYLSAHLKYFGTIYSYIEQQNSPGVWGRYGEFFETGRIELLMQLSGKLSETIDRGYLALEAYIQRLKQEYDSGYIEDITEWGVKLKSGIDITTFNKKKMIMM